MISENNLLCGKLKKNFNASQNNCRQKYNLKVLIGFKLKNLVSFNYDKNMVFWL